MHWYRLLALFLWIAPHVMLVVIAAVIYRRRLYREFPGFFVYVLYTIGVFILLIVMHYLPSVTENQYSYAYYATLLPSVALRFGVIGEISRYLFRESPFLQKTTRRSLQCVTGLLLVMSILLAIYAPGNNNVWIDRAIVVNRQAAMIQAGLLVSLLLFSPLPGIVVATPGFRNRTWPRGLYQRRSRGFRGSGGIGQQPVGKLSGSTEYQYLHGLRSDLDRVFACARKCTRAGNGCVR